MLANYTVPFTRSHWHAIIRYVHACTTRTLRGRECWRGIVSHFSIVQKKRKVLRNFDNFRRSTCHHPHNERKKGTNMILEKLSVLFEDPSYTVWSQNTRKDLYFIYLSKSYRGKNEVRGVLYIYIYICKIWYRFEKEVRIWKTLSSIFEESSDSFDFNVSEGYMAQSLECTWRNNDDDYSTLVHVSRNYANVWSKE